MSILMTFAGVAAGLVLGGAIGFRWKARPELDRPAARLTEASLCDAIEAMDDGFTLWDANDRLRLWNGRFVAMYPVLAPLLHRGVTLEACMRAVVQGHYGHLAAEEQERLVEQRLDGHRRIVSPRRLVRPDGTQLLVLERLTAEGERVAIYRDVTEESRAVVALARSEAQFRDAIESMADGLILWGPDRRMRAWNGRLLSIMPHLAPILRPGIDLDEFVVRACAAGFPEWDAARRAAWVRDRQALAWVSDQRTCLSLSGDRHVAVAQRRTSDGGLVATYHDVTAETRAGRILAESEVRSRRLATAASNVQSGIVILDADSRIVWVNPAMAGMVGTTSDALIGQTPRAAFISAETPPEALAQVAESLNEGRRVRAEVVLRRADGSTAWVELDAAPIFGHDGRLESIVGLHTDIGERKSRALALERALVSAQEVNEQQRQFVSIASHEFRTPLAIIDGAAQRISAKLRDGTPEVVRRLDRIRGAVTRMTEIIERTLSSARLDEGRIEFQARPFDLGALLRETCDRQRQVSPGHEIILAPIPAGLVIEGDPKLLDQVMTNLLSNAVKYSGSDRRIDVLAAERGSWIDIAVCDRGVGIPADEIPKLFTRFFRASTSAGISGTGIGLHLIKELVALHGGSVDVASQPGQGSTFIVKLPRQQPLAARPEAAE